MPYTYVATATGEVMVVTRDVVMVVGWCDNPLDLGLPAAVGAFGEAIEAS